MRLKSLAPWVGSWQLPGSYAGVGGKGAEYAWMQMAMETECLKLTNRDYTGGTADIGKCFDQISRQLRGSIAKRAGMPRKTINA